jgi:hypothetical protein
MARGVKTGGRKVGTPNKVSGKLKDAIIDAAEKAGDKGGIVGYLEAQARANPGPFLALLGKVLPMQVAGDPDAPINHKVEVVFVSANS